MFFKVICPPALIYLVYGVVQITIDTIMGFWNKALIKFFVTLLFTLLLNYLCNIGLGIVSWIILMLPFVLMTVIITFLLFIMGLHPKVGKIDKEENLESNKQPILKEWVSKNI
tara:strand:- start:307 stop:645 length:339 start_codon:yes stop_codon:yes gene_type:complete